MWYNGFMEKAAKSVIKYYVTCNVLKNTIRTGWEKWNVDRERLESVAEHVYGTQMLAIAMASEYKYDIDLKKVLFMLAIHELGETLIGDITPFQMDRTEKERIEHEAVHKVLSGLLKGEEIEKLFFEFDAHETPEALFAYQCDKLECDLQCWLYEYEDCADPGFYEYGKSLKNPRVNELLDMGLSWSQMWMEYSQQTYPYDKNFREVSDHAMTYTIESLTSD